MDEESGYSTCGFQELTGGVCLVQRCRNQPREEKTLKMRTDLRAFVIKLASVTDVVGGGINTYSSSKDLLLEIKEKNRC